MVTIDPVDNRLGRLLSTHPVANRRYWATGGKALAFAVGGGLLMAYLIINPALAGARLLAYALIPTLAGLPVAVVQLTRAVRSGRNETFELYENGIARHATERRQSWTWGEVATLQANPEAAQAPSSPAPIDRLVRRLGWHFRCLVRFTDGSRIRFDEYTADGPMLAQALLERRPDAVRPPDVQRSMWILAGVLPVVIAACTVGVVLIYRYLDGTSAAQIGDGTLVGLALAMIACIVGVVLSTTVFVMVVIGIIGDRD